jgi:hypothetical protein
LAIYEPSDAKLLIDFDVFICPESNRELYSDLPENVVKIGCPHGVDIPLSKTLDIYGGGYCFDYVLSAISQDEPEPGRFYDLFPAQWRSHSQPFVCEIPFGFPKLDGFIERVKQLKHAKRAIIYHLSYLPIEQPWVYEHIQSVLTSLLVTFPDYDIIFRPHHLDRGSVWIQNAVKLGARFNHFIYSEADSYIDDYARGALMVCHRAYDLHLFGLATGCPSVICIPDTEQAGSVNHEQFLICQMSQLEKVVESALVTTQEGKDVAIIEQCKTVGIYNPGKAVATLVSQFDYLIQNRRHPDWHYFPLNTEFVQHENLEITLNLLSVRPANMLFLALMAKSKNSVIASLFAADSYSRATGLHYYYYRIGLKFFHDFVFKGNLTSGLEEAASQWWQYRGKNMLSLVVKELANFNEQLSEAECALQAHFADAEHDENVAEICPFLFELNALKWEPVSGPTVIYGGGQLSKLFVSRWSKHLGIEITAIVDSNPNTVGELIEGIPISSTTLLSSSDKPINVIIASQAYLGEIYKQIKPDLVSGSKCYAICLEPMLKMLVDIALEAWPSE